MAAKKVSAIVYVGELGRCACPGVKGEFVRDMPVRLAEDGYNPPPGEPFLTREEALSLVAQHRTVNYETDYNEDGTAIYGKVVTEPFKLIQMRVTDTEVRANGESIDGTDGSQIRD